MHAKYPFNPDLDGPQNGGVWILHHAKSLFPHPAVFFLFYPASRMTFAQFESRIPLNFVTNPESRRHNRSYTASRETPLALRRISFKGTFTYTQTKAYVPASQTKIFDYESMKQNKINAL